MSKMNVIHYGIAFYPYQGGSSVRLGALISHQHGIDSHIVTHVLEDDSKLHGAASIHRVENYYSMGTRRLLKELVQRYKPAAVILHNPRVMLFWCLVIDPLHTIPRIAEIHNFRDNTTLRQRLTGCLYRQMDTVVVLAQCALPYAVRTYGLPIEKVVAVRNGVPLHTPIDSSPAARSARMVFAYVGSFHEWQGVVLLARSLTRMPQSFFSIASVVLAGGGPCEAEVRTLLAPLLASGDVKLLGWVDAKKANQVVTDADVVLIPRLSTAGTEHVLPLKVFEAMVQGKMVLGTNVGGLREVLEDGISAVLVSANCADELGNAMFALAKNPGLVRKLGINAARAVKRWPTWSQAGAEYEKLIREQTSRRLRLHGNS